MDVSWTAQSGVDRYTVQYSQALGASQMGACNGTHSGSFTTTDASNSITIPESGGDMLHAFITYSITVTAIIDNISNSIPSVTFDVTTAQKGIIFYFFYSRFFCIIIYTSSECDIYF